MINNIKFECYQRAVENTVLFIYKECFFMKLMFVSDIHGSAYYAKKAVELYSQENAQKLILLGDILYHGPRNDLPKDYAPKEVFALLNEMKQEILAVRGNCDSEVDQMVLEFPIMADYSTMYLQNRMLFLTHGHLFNEENLPPMQTGDILMHGHTHLRMAVKRKNYYFINPGSISLPKGDEIHSYAIYEDGIFTTKDLQGNILEKLDVR